MCPDGALLPVRRRYCDDGQARATFTLMLIALFAIFLSLASTTFLITLHYMVCQFSCFLPVLLRSMCKCRPCIQMQWSVTVECIANVNLAAKNIQFSQRNCIHLFWVVVCSISYW